MGSVANITGYLVFWDRTIVKNLYHHHHHHHHRPYPTILYIYNPIVVMFSSEWLTCQVWRCRPAGSIGHLESPRKMATGDVDQWYTKRLVFNQWTSEHGDKNGWFWMVLAVVYERWWNICWKMAGKRMWIDSSFFGKKIPRECFFFCLKSPSNRLYHHIPWSWRSFLRWQRFKPLWLLTLYVWPIIGWVAHIWSLSAKRSTQKSITRQFSHLEFEHA